MSNMEYLSKERSNLLDVMKHADKEYADGCARGYLSKFTNALRGYRRRYFVLNPEIGTLEYYLPKDHKRIHPRGLMILSAAVISANQEDASTFSICLASGEVYKLRAAGNTERQLWIDKLRQVSENHGFLHRNQFSSFQPNKKSISLVQSVDPLRELLIRTRQKLHQLEMSIDKCSEYNETDMEYLQALGQSTIQAMAECCSAIHSTYHV